MGRFTVRSPPPQMSVSCTLFNLFNVLIAIALALVGAWSNMMFICIIAVNTLIGIVQELHAKKLVEKLSLLSAPTVRVIRDGKHSEIPIHELVEQDVIELEAGNQVCSDCVILVGEAEVNESLLTGESDPVLKPEGSHLLSGSFIVSGRCRACVEHVGAENYAAAIAREAKRLRGIHSELLSSMRKVTHFTAFLIPPLGILLFLEAFLLRGDTLNHAVVTTAAGLLGMLPKGLVLLISISLAVGIITLSRKKVLVQELFALETLAHVDTLCLDKTGTITKAQPVVSDVISFCDEEPDELLRIAACLEEHFPHSMAKAVVRAAMDKGLVHEENHSKVEYIVAHGISSRIQDKKVIIGSYHFVFEDEQCVIPQGKEELFESLSGECSHLYLAIDGVLAAVIAITDPIREEAPQVVSMLRKCGLSKIVMMTGDSERTAKVVAAKVGVDEYYSEVLPEDKASYVEKEHQAGCKVIMIGDGVNDSPALSAADVGIAICDGAEMAREIADITIAGDNLEELVTLKRLSNALVKRIHGNYRQIVGFNTGLILCGIGGVMQPATSALLHNTSTLAISVKSMKDLLNEKDEK